MRLWLLLPLFLPLFNFGMEYYRASLLAAVQRIRAKKSDSVPPNQRHVRIYKVSSNGARPREIIRIVEHQKPKAEYTQRPFPWERDSTKIFARKEKEIFIHHKNKGGVRITECYDNCHIMNYCWCALDSGRNWNQGKSEE